MYSKDDPATVTCEIAINSIYPQGESPQVKLKVSGDGSLEYFLDAFKAALIAFGFVGATVEKIVITEGATEE